MQVSNAVERVDQITKGVTIETQGQGIDGEIPAFLIVFYATVFDDGFATSAFVGLLSGPYKFHLHFTNSKHGSSEILENRDLSCTHHFCSFLGQCNPAPHHHNVNVFGGAIQQEVPDVSSNGEYLLVIFISDGANGSEQRMVEVVRIIHAGAVLVIKGSWEGAMTTLSLGPNNPESIVYIKFNEHGGRCWCFVFLTIGSHEVHF